MAEQPPDDAGFLSRWSRRKVAVRQGASSVQPVLAPVPAAQPEPSPAAPPLPPAASTGAPGPAAAAPAAPAAPALPTLDDVARLTRDSDYARFVAPGVDAGVKNAALKKLFTDPHFNVMDGLDTYIDDYGIADPLPAGMLRQMAQSQFLGLFTDEAPVPSDPVPPAASIPPPPAQARPDEDAALRLQPHDAAGPASTGQGAGPDPRGQC